VQIYSEEVNSTKCGGLVLSFDVSSNIWYFSELCKSRFSFQFSNVMKMVLVFETFTCPLCQHIFTKSEMPHLHNLFIMKKLTFIANMTYYVIALQQCSLLQVGIAYVISIRNGIRLPNKLS